MLASLPGRVKPRWMQGPHAAAAVHRLRAIISTGASRAEAAMRDINGDGFIDHLASSRDNQLAVAQNRTERTNLLRSVTRPLGARMDFDYTRDGNTYDQPSFQKSNVYSSRWDYYRNYKGIHDGPERTGY